MRLKAASFSAPSALLVSLLVATAPARAQDTTMPPQGLMPVPPMYSDGAVPPPALLGPGPVIHAYKDSDAWFGENRDHATLLDLGFVPGVDYFIHPLADLSSPIPAGTTVVFLSSNGFGLPGAVVAQNAPAAQANMEAFVRAGGVLIIDMGDNVVDGGFLAPGSTGTPEYIFPAPCDDATLAPAALGPDAILGTADDHPIVLGPDGLPGTADDLNDSNIDLVSTCSVAHGNLVDGIALPAGATSLMTAVFDGAPEPILAEYCLDAGLVIVDTITKEFIDHQGPTGPGLGPTFFMNNLFSYAVSGAWPCVFADGFEGGDTSAWSAAVP